MVVNTRDFNIIESILAETPEDTSLDFKVEKMIFDLAQEKLDESGKYDKEGIEERKQMKIALCGKVRMMDIHLASGTMFTFTMRCRQWRECASCREWRAKQLRDELLNSTDPETLGWGGSYHRMETFDSEEDAKEFYKTLGGKDNYRREPQSGGKVAIVWANDFDLPDEDQRGEKVTPETINNIDWEYIVCTPENKRPSGHYGKSKENDDGETVVIGVYRPVTDAPSDEIEHAQKQAEKNTSHLNPKTAEEVEQAYIERMDEAIRILEERGNKILYMEFKNKHVKIKDILWSKDNNSIQSYLEENNLRAEISI